MEERHGYYDHHYICFIVSYNGDDNTDNGNGNSKKI